MIFKTSTLRLALIIFSGITLNAQSNPPQLPQEDCCSVRPVLIDGHKSQTTDTIICKRWNSATESWGPKGITICNYDDYGRLVNEVNKSWNYETEMYQPLVKIVRSWYENDSIQSLARYFWNPDLNDGSWDLFYNYHYEYNEDGLRNYLFSEYSQYGSPDWYNGGKAFYFYNSAGLTDSIVTQYWNTNLDEWYYSNRARYVYDDDFNLVEMYNDYANNPEGDFALNTRLIYIPGYTANQVQEIEEYYSLEEWHHYKRNLVTYNDQDLKVVDLYQQWDPTLEIWDTVVMQKELYDYYENGLMKNLTTQSYYISWANMNRLNWTYDEFGNMTSQLEEEWDFYNEMWQNNELCTYPQPQTITALNDPAGESSNKLVTLWPNPATDYFRISIGGNAGNLQHVEIYNRAGQIIQTANATYEFHVGNYPAGVYFVKVSGPDFQSIQKLVIR